MTDLKAWKEEYWKKFNTDNKNRTNPQAKAHGF